MRYTFFEENCLLTPGRLGLMTDESLLELGELVLAMDRRALTATAGESGKSPISWSLHGSGWASTRTRCKRRCCAAGGEASSTARGSGEIDRGGGQGGASRVLPAGQS